MNSGGNFILKIQFSYIIHLLFLSAVQGKMKMNFNFLVARKKVIFISVMNFGVFGNFSVGVGVNLQFFNQIL